jgi:hypothetical protein
MPAASAIYRFIAPGYSEYALRDTQRRQPDAQPASSLRIRQFHVSYEH